MSSHNHKELFVSIVVPIYNGELRINHCLMSLLEQSYSENTFEIIAVDNNSQDNTAHIIKELSGRYPGRIKYILEDKNQGIAAARNAGIKHAKGDLICFTDDDCVVDRDWLSHIVRIFQSTDAKAVQGRIILSTPIPDHLIYPQKYIQDRMAHVDYSDEVFRMENENMVGANMSYVREIFEQFGLFSDHYRLVEDTEFSKRLSSAGISRYYCPQAIVYHHYSLSRLNDKSLLKQSFLYGRVSVIDENLNLSPFRYFCFCLKESLCHFINSLRYQFSKNKQEAFMEKSRMFSQLGRCSYIWSNGFKRIRN